MADRVRKINYCYVKVPNRAGHGARVLEEVRNAGINLWAYSGFPVKGGAQLDMATDDLPALRRVARQNGWRLSKPKRGFLVTGSDDVGSVYRTVRKLADKKINITAADGVAAGKGRYGMILWVKPKDYARAARTLRAK